MEPSKRTEKRPSYPLSLLYLYNLSRLLHQRKRYSSAGVKRERYDPEWRWTFVSGFTHGENISRHVAFALDRVDKALNDRSVWEPDYVEELMSKYPELTLGDLDEFLDHPSKPNPKIEKCIQCILDSVMNGSAEGTSMDNILRTKLIYKMVQEYMVVEMSLFRHGYICFAHARSSYFLFLDIIKEYQTKQAVFTPPCAVEDKLSYAFMVGRMMQESLNTDHAPGWVERLISLNGSPFMNFYNAGESTLDYLRRNINVNLETSTFGAFAESLNITNVPSKLTTLANQIRNVTNSLRVGNLLLFAVPRSEMNRYIYVSKAGGFPLDTYKDTEKFLEKFLDPTQDAWNDQELGSIQFRVADLCFDDFGKDDGVKVISFQALSLEEKTQMQRSVVKVLKDSPKVTWPLSVPEPPIIKEANWFEGRKFLDFYKKKTEKYKESKVREAKEHLFDFIKDHLISSTDDWSVQEKLMKMTYEWEGLDWGLDLIVRIAGMILALNPRLYNKGYVSDDSAEITAFLK